MPIVPSLLQGPTPNSPDVPLVGTAPSHTTPAFRGRDAAGHQLLHDDHRAPAHIHKLHMNSKPPSNSRNRPPTVQA